jgi:hypothetical protein
MKKILGLSAVIALIAGANSVGAYTLYEAPNAGNMNFYPMMQRQMQQEETLDFVNNPEGYKERREAKDNGNKIRNSNFNPNYSPNYGGAFMHPVHPVQMQFTKDANGNIRIQGLHSNNESITNTNTTEDK